MSDIDVVENNIESTQNITSSDTPEYSNDKSENITLDNTPEYSKSDDIATGDDKNKATTKKKAIICVSVVFSIVILAGVALFVAIMVVASNVLKQMDEMYNQKYKELQTDQTKDKEDLNAYISNREAELAEQRRKDAEIEELAKEREEQDKIRQADIEAAIKYKQEQLALAEKDSNPTDKSNTTPKTDPSENKSEIENDGVINENTPGAAPAAENPKEESAKESFVRGMRYKSPRLNYNMKVSRRK